MKRLAGIVVGVVAMLSLGPIAAVNAHVRPGSIELKPATVQLRSSGSLMCIVIDLSPYAWCMPPFPQIWGHA
jgi:hypothetical protein